MESVNSRLHEKFLDLVYYSFTIAKKPPEINGLGLKTFRGARRHVILEEQPDTPTYKSAAHMVPSVRILLKRFTDSHIFADTYPVIRCGLVLDTPVQTIKASWQNALASCSNFASAPADTPHAPFIPVSYASHDSDQLVWGRPGVPMCSAGDECEARRYSGNQGCLHAYLTPAQQDLFDKNEPFEMPSPPFCLLCIRCEIHSLLLAWESLIANPRQQIGRDIICVPPLQNLVDVPGGYIRSVVGISQSAHSIISSVAVVGITGMVSVKYNPNTKQFYIDQSRIVWPQQHFLC